MEFSKTGKNEYRKRSNIKLFTLDEVRKDYERNGFEWVGDREFHTRLKQK